jgi:hypothetical protein
LRGFSRRTISAIVRECRRGFSYPAIQGAIFSHDPLTMCLKLLAIGGLSQLFFSYGPFLGQLRYRRRDRLAFLILCLVVCAAVFALEIIVFLAGVPHAFADGWREGKSAQARNRKSAPRFRNASAIGLRRAWRLARHPLRERAFWAESLRALRHPMSHHWSDGLS